MSQTTRFILTLSCADRAGIVRDVSAFVADQGGNIIESAQFGDPETHVFCMRLAFELDGADLQCEPLADAFRPVAESFSMDWTLFVASKPARVLVMASKFDHCLANILYRQKIGELNIEIPAVVSNHRDTYQLVAAHDIPFHHLPITPDNKLDQEARLRELIESDTIDFVVLARYMQILTTELCDDYRGRIINIHHSFLPGFKGAKPYHQAHGRGVKLIGATAHYATADLDEGPIIEQDVTRVTHAQTPEQLVALGRDIEMRVLSRAVKLQAEHRVMLNGDKTVVFQ
ncbi:MAG: formyltetrahydrofolate deformylase [Pseudomonadota bacterium]